MDLQKRLFEIIKTKLPNQIRLVDVIEELLGICSDSAYRRIRCETELSLSEFQKICRKFDLSMDELVYYNSSQSALFNYTPADIAVPEAYMNYMSQLCKRLNFLHSASNKEILYTAQDIPFYHFYKFPELAFFRLFTWYDTLHRNALSYDKFCSIMEKDKILPIYENVYQSYMGIPSKEIWTEQTVDTILRTLEFYYEIKSFENKDTFLFLLDQLINLLDMVKQFANDGYKINATKNPFSLYCCSVELENNFMLTIRDNELSCILKLYTVNRVVTDNSVLCLQIQKWIESLISKSILISGDGSFKERFNFFNSIRNRVQKLINKVLIN